MARKNPSGSYYEEMLQLVAEYEAATASGKQPYYDSLQLADIADTYLTQWRFADAQKVIEYGLYLYPNDVDLLVEKARYYIDIQEHKKAKEVVDGILDQSDEQVAFVRAELLLYDDKAEEANEIFENLEEANTLDDIIEIIFTFMDLGYYEQAEKWIEKAKIRYAGQEMFQSIQAEYLSAIGEQDEAIDIFNRLLDDSPYNITYWTGLARCHFRNHETEKALEACDFALTADENCGEAYTLRAYSNFYKGNAEQALLDFGKAIKHHAISPELGNMFTGLSYVMLRQWEKAIHYFDKVIGLLIGKRPKDPTLLIDMYNNKAYALAQLKRFPEAHELSRKALELDPRYCSSYLTEGKILLMQQMDEEASHVFHQVLEIDPHAETWADIAVAYLENNQMEKAKKCYEQAHRLNPESTDILDRLCITSLLSADVDGFDKYCAESQRVVSLAQTLYLISESAAYDDETMADVVNRLLSDNLLDDDKNEGNEEEE
ncbi:MAG: tetratricopeptide repeat protein [Mediterranea sp.]|jgi:tetratricopeptide (TPR) repeat protein|nr:tetratricopeptide repeat protein [Mediterranea sp.]